MNIIHLFADFKLRSCSHDNGTERLASGQFTEKPIDIHL